MTQCFCVVFFYAYYTLITLLLYPYFIIDEQRLHQVDSIRHIRLAVSSCYWHKFTTYSDAATIEYNYEPYMRHKQLLLMTLKSLCRDTTHWVMRRKAIKVLCIVGALDPLLYRANNRFIERVNRQIKREQEKTN